jgi:hypothetical protein
VEVEPLIDAPELEAEPLADPLALAPPADPLPLAEPPSVPIGVVLPPFDDGDDELLAFELSGFDLLKEAFCFFALFDAICDFFALPADLVAPDFVPCDEAELPMLAAVLSVSETAAVDGTDGVDGVDTLGGVAFALAVPLTEFPFAEPLAEPDALAPFLAVSSVFLAVSSSGPVTGIVAP